MSKSVYATLTPKQLERRLYGVIAWKFLILPIGVAALIMFANRIDKK